MRRNLLFVLALTLAVSPPLFAQRSDRGFSRIDTTFVFDKGGEVNLTLLNGDVRVTAWARSDARVVAASNQAPITATFSPNRIKLALPPRITRSGNGTTTYDLMVPIGTRVTVGIVAGGIHVNGTRSDVKLSTVSGSVDVGDAAGHVEVDGISARVSLQRVGGTIGVSTVGGGVTIAEVTGDLEIESVSGAAKITSGDVQSLRYHTVSGDLDFSGHLLAQGRHAIETFSGSVTLHLPADFGATLQFESFSGRLRPVDFPVTLQPNGNSRGRGKDRQDLVINDGSVHISIQTFSGDVFLRKAAATTRR